MRVAIAGGLDPVALSVARALQRDKSVDTVLGLTVFPVTGPVDIEWRQIELSGGNLGKHFTGVDAVVHLGWPIPSSRDPMRTDGGLTALDRTLSAVVDAGVGAFVHASSSSVYSPGNRRTRVDETWPTDGIERSVHSRQRVAEEHVLDEFEARHAFVRVIRIRSALTIDADAPSEQSWLDSTVGRWMARSGFIPDIKGLVLQAVHIDDLADAYRLAVLGSVVGAYNIAAEPVIDARSLRAQLGLRTVSVSPRLARVALRTGWHLGLIPLEPERLDLGLGTPLMATDRARDELGWCAQRSVFDDVRATWERLRAGCHPRSD